MAQNNAMFTGFPEFMINNSQKKQTVELLNDLKTHLNFMITEFLNIFVNSYDDLISKCKLFIDNYYKQLMKIKFYLSLLEIKDKNQTNKYEYERCLRTATFINFANLVLIIQKIYEFINFDFEMENQNIIDIAKIHDKEDEFCNSLIIKYEKNIDKQIINQHDIIIIKFNNYMNIILLEILSINEIVKNINISSNNNY